MNRTNDFFNELVVAGDRIRADKEHQRKLEQAEETERFREFCQRYDEERDRIVARIANMIGLSEDDFPNFLG